MASLCACGKSNKSQDGNKAPTDTFLVATPQRTASTIIFNDSTDTVLHCTNAILVSLKDNTILAEKNARDQAFTASLTKVMTMLTFLELCTEADLVSTYAPTEQLLSSGVWTQAATRARIYPDEPCVVEELLYAMILPSGADAALCLANYKMGGEPQFVEQMNALGKRIGLEHTHYTNVTGLHDSTNYSTALDVARVMAYAIQDPFGKLIISTPEYVMTPTRQHRNGIHLRHTVFQRLNRLREANPDVQIPINGGKTGFTSEAGQCLATYYEDPKGNQYVCVVIGCPRRDGMMPILDTMTMYDLAGVLKQPSPPLQQDTITEQ